MQSFLETKLSEKMQRTCYATKTKETCKREIGLFDIGIGLAGKRSKKAPLILIPSTTSMKWNLARKPIDLRRKKTKKTYKVNFNSEF